MEDLLTAIHKCCARPSEFEGQMLVDYAQFTLLTNLAKAKDYQIKSLIEERDALQAKFDSGVRVYTSYDIYEEDGGRFSCYHDDDNWKPNATLILDEVNEPPNP